jgi:putative heme-binding domain-containing protein
MLDPLYPSASQDMNHELCQLLLHLNAPQAIGKTLALLTRAPSQEEQIYYAASLRSVTNGWTLPQHQDYLRWFLDFPRQPRRANALEDSFRQVGQEYFEGVNFDQYLDKLHQEAISALSTSEREALASYIPKNQPLPAAPPAARKFVKAWRMEDLLPHLSKLDDAKTGRHFARGRNIFFQAQCALCHHFVNIGGSFGPDLTAVGSRMAPRDILESIIEPSKVVPDQYRDTVFELKNGDILAGRVIDESDNGFLLISDPVRMNRINLPKAGVLSRHVSKISPMPEGLIDSLTEDEIWDLVACLRAGVRSYDRVAPGASISSK